jgi:hypothetical protein
MASTVAAGTTSSTRPTPTSVGQHTSPAKFTGSNLDLYEPLGVPQARGVHHFGADERRDHHRILEWELAAVGQADLAGGDPFHGDVEDPLDLLSAEEHAQQLLPAGQPADPEVPRERLGADVGDRHLQLLLAQVVGGIEEELVGGAEAGRALGCGDHHRTGVVHQPCPALGGVDRPLQGGDGVSVAARPEPELLRSW